MQITLKLVKKNSEPSVRYHLRNVSSTPDWLFGDSGGASRVPIARPVLWPVFDAPLWQQPLRKPSHGISSRPPVNQQDKKNSQVAPEAHNSCDPNLVIILC